MSTATHNRRPRFGELLLLGLLVWFAAIPIHSWLTARERVRGQLDDALWNLQQQTAARGILSEAQRREYLSQLRSRDESERWAAAAKLASWRDPSCIPALVAAMQDDAGTRRTCVIAQALGQLGRAEAVPALLQAIEHPSNRDLRLCATKALAQIGDERALEPLIAKAQDRSRRDGFLAAVTALGEWGAVDAVPVLRRIAEGDPDESVRGVAQAAIRQIQILSAPDPVSELIALLECPQDWISDGWTIAEMGKRWDHRVAIVLNEYVSRTAVRSEHRIQASALLIHHGAFSADTVQRLEGSPKRQDRLLAEIVRGHDSVQTAPERAMTNQVAFAISVHKPMETRTRAMRGTPPLHRSISPVPNP